MIADALYIRTLNVQGYSPVCVLNSCSVPTERDTSEYISAERTHQDTLANRKVTPARCYGVSQALRARIIFGSLVTGMNQDSFCESSFYSCI